MESQTCEECGHAPDENGMCDCDWNRWAYEQLYGDEDDEVEFR